MQDGGKGIGKIKKARLVYQWMVLNGKKLFEKKDRKETTRWPTTKRTMDVLLTISTLGSWTMIKVGWMMTLTLLAATLLVSQGRRAYSVYS